MPFALTEDRIKALHEEAGDGKKNDRISESHGLHRLGIDFRICDDGSEVAVRIPKQSADKSQQKHGGCGHRDGTAQKNEMYDEKTRMTQTGERRHKLLHQEGDEQKDNSAEIVAEQAVEI